MTFPVRFLEGPTPILLNTENLCEKGRLGFEARFVLGAFPDFFPSAHLE